MSREGAGCYCPSLVYWPEIPANDGIHPCFAGETPPMVSQIRTLQACSVKRLWLAEAAPLQLGRSSQVLESRCFGGAT